MNTAQRAVEIIQILKKTNPNAKTELVYETPLDFMVAVILSAQATDKGVNKATPELFKRFRTAQDYANSSPEEISKYIKTINFYNSKAKRIFLASKFLVENLGGEVPSDMASLLKIPGIARKSANVIQQEVFGIVEGIVVDTHVIRLSNRLGLTNQKDAVKIEKDLMELLPKEYWKDFGRQIVLHGRYICKAVKPQCSVCPINHLCPSSLVDVLAKNQTIV